MNSNVPDMSIARGDRTPVAFNGTPFQAPGFVTVAPPPPAVHRGATQGPKKQTGLLPAIVGALFPLVVRDRPRERVSPRDISIARAEVRRAERDRAAAEAAWVASATKDPTGQGDRDLLVLARDATDREAMLRRKLGELEAAATQKATQVRLARVVDPSEVPDALANSDTPPVYVCMHDGCRHERWDSEQEMRRAHPTNLEMQRAQQAHVFALLSDAPIDPLDPDGDRVGFIAPIGRDGATVERAVSSIESSDSRDDEIEDLRAQLDSLRALLEEKLGSAAAEPGESAEPKRRKH